MTTTDVKAMAERLRDRARRKSGKSVGASDGCGTVVPSYYMVADFNLDFEAADLLDRLSTQAQGEQRRMDQTRPQIESSRTPESVPQRPLSKTQFIVQMIVAYARLYPGTTTVCAMAQAAETFREFMAYEKIEYGDPRYAWDTHAAETLIREYEGVDAETRPSDSGECPPRAGLADPEMPEGYIEVSQAIPGSDDMDARFDWLQSKAVDMGYMLVPEKEHPDSPHAAQSDDVREQAADIVRSAINACKHHNRDGASIDALETMERLIRALQPQPNGGET